MHRALTRLALLHPLWLAVWLGPVAFGFMAAARALIGWLELGGLPLLAALGVWCAVLLRCQSLLPIAAPLGLAAAVAALGLRRPGTKPAFRTLLDLC